MKGYAFGAKWDWFTFYPVCSYYGGSYFLFVEKPPGVVSLSLLQLAYVAKIIYGLVAVVVVWAGGK